MGVFDGDDASAPPADEVEVIVFGPGYGESIAVHLGIGEWLIVDSCTTPEGQPAPLAYFDKIGVKPEQVKYFAVSHWHDDHTSGASRIAEACAQARIGISSVLNLPEGREFVAAFSRSVAAGSSGTSELFNVIRKCKGRLEPLSQNKTVLTGAAYRVTALSPTDECFLQAQAAFRSQLPSAELKTPIRHAARFSPNNEAVALHVAIGDTTILLGSDLETNKQGWSVLTEHPEILKLPRAGFYKVAHHGSETAECENVWTRLLAPQPLSVLTPFQCGRHRLPNESDRTRLRARSLAVHISSMASSKAAMDRKLAQRLAQLGSAPVQAINGFGAVRARRKIAANGGWTIKYFGTAGVVT